MIVSALFVLATAMSIPSSSRSALIKPSPVQPFPLSEVQLTGGPWLRAQQMTEQYLLSLEPERLLHGFRKNAGLTPKAPLYGGWEDAGLAGHTLGHYLTACSQAYAASGDVRFKKKTDAIVAGLAECQAARPDGCVSAIPNGDKAWDAIRKGDIRSAGFDLNGLWSPWYTHHKVLAGLMDTYTLTGSRQALEVAKKFADWAVDLTRGLDDAHWQKMLRCEYGGMNEALAELYQLTGADRYLALSRKFYDHASLDPIVAGEDKLAGTHSNTQIPKILGLARLSDTRGGGDYRSAVKFFWDRVVNHHTYVIGGHGDHEYFTAADKLNEELTTNTCETCCTYNMLKLSRQLFSWEPQAQYLDFYERAHLNDILASQDPDTGMVTYFFPLLSGAKREYSDPEHNFTCCHGTGMENHTKHQDGVYYHSGGDCLYVAQFVPSHLHWKETGLEIEQATDFPDSGKVSIKILHGTGKPITVKLRHPGWATAYPVKLNGKQMLLSSDPDTFDSLSRRWKKGDVIEFDMPMAFHSEPILGDTNKLALLYGPTVLAADLGPDDGADLLMPVLIPDGKPADKYLKKTGSEEFSIEDAARPGKLTLRPLYRIVHNRYAVYFDVFTQEKWTTVESAFRAEEARIKDLDSRTVDIMRVGEMQPERDHHLTSERCDAREANGKGFRTPFANGYFEFDLKVDPKASIDLVVTYWINNRGIRAGALSVDGQIVSDFSAVNALPNNTFQDISYTIPRGLTGGKDHVRIRFSGSVDRAAASVSKVRAVRSTAP